ncbi:hypothetical protein AAC387_Pa02g5004 [Persea americana]
MLFSNKASSSNQRILNIICGYINNFYATSKSSPGLAQSIKVQPGSDIYIESGAAPPCACPEPDNFTSVSMPTVHEQWACIQRMYHMKFKDGQCEMLVRIPIHAPGRWESTLIHSK